MVTTGFFPESFKKSKIVQLYIKREPSLLTAEHQFGFHKLHSTEHAAVELIDHVTKLMESSHTPSKFVICI